MDDTVKKSAVQLATHLLRGYEGFRRKAYRHKVLNADGSWSGKWEPWTVGYGFTFDEEGKPFNENSIMEQSRAEALLAKMTANRLESILKTLPGIELNKNQAAAVVSLHHNIGPGNWNSSTVRRMILAKRFKEAADAFLMWKRGNSANDLLPRRQKERALFLEAV